MKKENTTRNIHSKKKKKEKKINKKINTTYIIAIILLPFFSVFFFQNSRNRMGQNIFDIDPDTGVISTLVDDLDRESVPKVKYKIFFSFCP